MIEIKSAAASNLGNIRENNEDTFYLNGKLFEAAKGVANEFDTSSCGFFAVFDGMGGEAFGEVASAIAAQILQKYHKKIINEKTSSHEIVNEYCIEANALICDEINKTGKRMGTTFALLFVQNNIVYAYNIGDSRIYLYKDGQIAQLSKDHTQATRLIDMGIITKEMAKTHPARHTLTQHLGIFPEEMIIEPFAAIPVTIAGGEIFLLCTDGLTDMLDDNEIKKNLCPHADVQNTANKLIDAALEKGGRDNITVIVSKIMATSPL